MNSKTDALKYRQPFAIGAFISFIIFYGICAILFLLNGWNNNNYFMIVISVISSIFIVITIQCLRNELKKPKREMENKEDD